MQFMETITTKTKSEIDSLLKEYQDRALSYAEKREARKLWFKAWDEVFESTKLYGEEFEKIQKKFKDECNRIMEDSTYAMETAIGLVMEFNRELEALHAGFCYNFEIRSLLQSLDDLIRKS